MNRLPIKVGAALALMAALAACGGGDGGGTPTPETDFTALVKDMLARSPDSEPVAINMLDFRFSDDPDAYDDVLQ